MARVHEIAIASETGAFEKGIKSGVIQPLQDAEKALKDLGDTSVGRDIDQDLAVAQRATKELKSETKEAADAIERSFRDSYGKVKRESTEATSKVKAGFGEAKEEAASSGREAAASFGGGFDDAADFVQETLANALSGFGPAGAAAGIALAAILGTALAQAASAQEALTEAREAAADLASTMYENGGELPLQERIDELFSALNRESRANGVLQKLIDDWSDYGTVLEDVEAVAKRTGRPLAELVRALSGSDLSATRAELKRVNDELDSLSDWTPVWDEQYQSLTSYKNELTSVVKTQELAAKSLDAVGQNSKRIDDLANAWTNAGVAAEDYFTKGEDGLTSFDVSGYLTAMEQQIAAADELKRDLVTLPSEIAQEAERLWNEQGVTAADAYVDGYQGADAATQARLRAVAGPQGQAAGRASAEGFVSAANQGLANWRPSAKDVEMRVRVDTRNWDNWNPKAKTAYVNYVVNEGRNHGGL
ncbi:hypothetical protein [Microbacterium sp. 22296]|uniref:hypothetical protein n=1 Tax=Microbacterium sp. 22296 TaxID=3453903 RepID=UPI003F8479BA